MSEYTFGDLDKYQQPQASNLSSPDQWLVDWYRGGTNTDSGATVMVRRS